MAGTVVQSQVAEGVASATTIASGSFSSNVTAGNTLWVITNSDTADTVAITKNSGTATIGTVTDEGSVTEAGTAEELTHFTIPITGTGSLDLLATFGSSQANRQILAFELSGVFSILGSDEQTDTGSDPTTTLTVNVTAQPAFGLSVCIDAQGGTPGVGTGWTNVGTFGGTVHNARVQSKSITSTGNTTANFGNATLNRNNAALIVFDETSPDTTAPVLTSPTGTATGSTTATIGATTDEGNGTMYAVVTTSATQPTVAQIKAGQDHTGAAAAWGGGQAISSTGAKTLNATGLTASTNYWGHLVHTDAAANDSNRVTSAQFTTSVFVAGPRIYPVNLGSAPIGLFVLGSAGGGADFTFAGSGGITFSGVATAVEANDYVFSPSGGLTFGGAATAAEANDYTFSPSGGVVFGGAATAAEANDYTFAPSGGIVFGGDAIETAGADFEFVASGGVTFGGDGAEVYSPDYIASPAGGIVFGGAAAAVEANDYEHSPSGGVTFGGDATEIVETGYEHVGSGGIVFGGAATVEGPPPSAGGQDWRRYAHNRRGR